MDEVVSLYETYISEFLDMEQAKKPWQGAFGLGTRSSDYACHDTFLQDVEQLLNRLTAQNTPPEQAREILTYIYFTAPNMWQNETAAYWVLLAVHGLTAGLARLLDPDSAASLCGKYAAVYPKNQRLPAQNGVVEVLVEKALSLDLR